MNYLFQRMGFSVRFQLRPLDKQSLQPQGPGTRRFLQVRISTEWDKQRRKQYPTHPVEKRIGATWQHKKLWTTEPDWLVDRQKSATDTELNANLRALEARIYQIHQEQSHAAPPTNESICHELMTGHRPEYDLAGRHWIILADQKAGVAPVHRPALSEKTPITLSYAAFLAEKTFTPDKRGHIAKGRWVRGGKLLRQYCLSVRHDPACGSLTLGFLKRYHGWLQTQTGGHCEAAQKPISAAQATRYLGFLGKCLDWLIQDEIIPRNVKKLQAWPRHEDKDVTFLEPHHVRHLMTLRWRGTNGQALWWFLLMCCTGMDYPDAKQYVMHRATYEVPGPYGVKLRGHRLKPPHELFECPKLPQVDLLLSAMPTGALRCSDYVVNRYTVEIQSELGIEWRITKKTGRKTFGCLMLMAGVPLEAVSRFLGHRRITTTMRHYVKITGSYVDLAMSQVNLTNVLGSQDPKQKLDGSAEAA